MAANSSMVRLDSSSFIHRDTCVIFVGFDFGFDTNVKHIVREIR